MIRKRKLAIVVAGIFLLVGVAFGVSAKSNNQLSSSSLNSSSALSKKTITVGLGNTSENIELSGYVKGWVVTSVSFTSKQDISSVTLKSIDFRVKSVEGKLPNLNNFNLRSYNDILLSQYSCKKSSTKSKQFLVSCKLIKWQEPVTLSWIWLDASIKTDGAGKMRITPKKVQANTTKVKFSYIHPGTLVSYQTSNTAYKCGSAVNTVSAIPPTNNLCETGTVVIGVKYDPTTTGSNGNGTWTWRCGIDGSSSWDTCYAMTPTPKCGSAVNTISATAPTDNLCEAGVVVFNVKFDPTTTSENGNGMWMWRCGVSGTGTWAWETCLSESK